MTSGEFLNPSEAARRLGVSAKALRLYEAQGLMTPLRSEAGWRSYGPVEMARAAEIATLRKLKLSLAQVARVLDGDAESLAAALMAHQVSLEAQATQLSGTIAEVRSFREKLSQGQTPDIRALADILEPAEGARVAFDLPWPWGGERFELNGIPHLTFITGPLGSGKTRLARRIAEKLPGAVFVGLDRLDEGGAGERPGYRQTSDAAWSDALSWLLDDGAADTQALRQLLSLLHAEGADILVIDMVEQGLDEASQEALMRYLRRRPHGAASLFLLTRSNAILDVTLVGSEERILFCPANHSPPVEVKPYAGAPGYEALTSCLASPDVRARTEGVVVLRSGQA
ncbi:MerR family transcriptional regulator [Denitrobaculum tricleocarpae]|uniref:MerR family transcriptional regulator n=1 Tax=Denitrobaculum tricleocarpae TaxID=2591009 RepID=A0A545TYL4_9PROT|nr:MerR family transcriptional regulator [Denitrobaculum tricleocarpae]TQV82291.1 MerR family transcriptional regulator [Denitrobaculum tricleocarpae]